MTSVDRLGFNVRLKTQDRVHGARIAFLQEVTNPTQTREVFVEMVEQARQEVNHLVAVSISTGLRPRRTA